MTRLSILSSCLLNVRNFFSALEFMKERKKNSLLMRAWSRIETCPNCLGWILFCRRIQIILLKCFHEIFFQVLTYNTMVWKLQKKLVKIQRHNNRKHVFNRIYINPMCRVSIAIFEDDNEVLSKFATKGIQDRRMKKRDKVIYPKYSKHWPYLLASTLN